MKKNVNELHKILKHTSPSAHFLSLDFKKKQTDKNVLDVSDETYLSHQYKMHIDHQYRLELFTYVIGMGL